MVLSAPLPQTAIIRDEAVDEYATHAIEHTPSEGQIEQLQRDYYLSVVSELFDFRPLMDAFNRVLDLLDGHFRRSFPKLIAEYKARTGTIKTELMDVAERFKLQYSQIVIASADYQTNALLQERLKKRRRLLRSKDYRCGGACEEDIGEDREQGREETLQRCVPSAQRSGDAEACPPQLCQG